MPNEDYIDIYCERLAPSLLAEPLNLFSNLAFFAAAWLLWRLHRSSPSPAALPLIALIFMIGAGSSAFHAFATRTTMWMDVIPIVCFVYAYLWISLRQLCGFAVFHTILCIILFSALATAAGFIPDSYSLNGSATYVPCLITIGLLAAYLNGHHDGASQLIGWATCVFALSLCLRSIDMWICPALLFGTHMFWHILNGVTLYLLTLAVMTGTRVLDGK